MILWIVPDVLPEFSGFFLIRHFGSVVIVIKVLTEPPLIGVELTILPVFFDLCFVSLDFLSYC